MPFCVRASLVHAYRILTVSNPWVTVTAPHAAIPPAMNELDVLNLA